MGTRAVIIRKKKAGNIELMEWGQTHFDGYDNTKILNAGWKGKKKVDMLFDRMRVQGISSLRTTPEDTVWYDDGTYNYGAAYHTEGWLSPEIVTSFLVDLDWPEYASVWDGKKWHDFKTQLYHPDETDDMSKYDRYKLYATLNISLTKFLKELFYPTQNNNNDND